MLNDVEIASTVRYCHIIYEKACVSVVTFSELVKIDVSVLKRNLMLLLDLFGTVTLCKTY